MNRKVLHSAALLISAALGLCVITNPALAAQGQIHGASLAPGARVGNSIIVNASPGSIELTAAPGVPKADYHPEQDLQSPIFTSLRSRAATGITPDGSWSGQTAYLSGDVFQEITPPGGSQAQEEAQFSSSDPFNFPCCLNDSMTFDGAANAYWLGANPYFATTVSLNETYEVTGVNISANFSGIGFSGGGSNVNWSGSVPNNWTVYHSFSNSPSFHGTYMWNAYEYATTQLQFGNNYFSLEASDSVALP